MFNWAFGFVVGGVAMAFFLRWAVHVTEFSVEEEPPKTDQESIDVAITRLSSAVIRGEGIKISSDRAVLRLSPRGAYAVETVGMLRSMANIIERHIEEGCKISEDIEAFESGAE